MVLFVDARFVAKLTSTKLIGQVNLVSFYKCTIIVSIIV